MDKYVISIDQSTQGTKALLFNEKGSLIKRIDKPHKQIIDEHGWISHNPVEIYHNVITSVKQLILESQILPERVAGVAISNQRETALAWSSMSKEPLADAVVWQCARAADLCEQIEKNGYADVVRERTGIHLSPYFPAAKIGWILKHHPSAQEALKKGEICYGTIDSWLVYKLTDGKSYKTDFSNASRTQLFDIFKLKWDKEICNLFGIDPAFLPEVCDSDSYFGETDFDGVLPKKVPIHGVMGDSHSALYGQGCLHPGMLKATYGTGSSIMMNVGEAPVVSNHGIVTSLAWSLNGKVNYVLEGNLNYTGAVITWLKDDLKLITSPQESQELAKCAVQDDKLYLVPAFSGMGAPYWNSKAKASILGMSRTTGKKEIVRAGIESIAYQISDVIKAMEEDSDMPVKELRVDGGPTRNEYLMQFQSNISNVVVQIPNVEELSGIGVAYAAGISLEIWDDSVLRNLKRVEYVPDMSDRIRKDKYSGWKRSVATVLTNTEM